MANTPQAKKRIRSTANRAEINGARVGRIRTHATAVESAHDKGGTHMLAPDQASLRARLTGCDLLQSRIETGRRSRSGGPFVSQVQKFELFPRFAICAPPQKPQKRRITAKLTNFCGFSVSSRFIFTFVKKAA